MHNQPRSKRSKLLHFPYSGDLRYTLMIFAIVTLPQLILLFICLSEKSIVQDIKLLVLIVSGVQLVFSIIAFTHLIFGILKPISDTIHSMELCHKTANEAKKANKILNSLLNLSQYMRTWEEQQNRLEILQKQANLFAYQSQINPHFLYNMLDTIRGQALEDGSVISSDMIEALSRMMRYAIGDKNSMVSLGTELKSIDNYIKIQQFRFGNRFQYIKHLDEIDSGLIEINIPKMTLQPIVENAVFHGVESLHTGGEINLTAFNTQSRLVIQISDNGKGMDENQLSEVRQKLRNSSINPNGGMDKGMGIALTNVNARLQLAFGSKYGLSVYSTQNIGTMIEITLPIKIENYIDGEKDVHAYSPKPSQSLQMGINGRVKN